MPMDPKTRDWLLEHYREGYEFQVERSDKIRDTVSLLSGLLSILGGAIAYIVLNYPHAWHGWEALYFYSPAGLALVLFCIAVGQIFYCIGRGYKYSYILSPHQLQAYTESLVQYAAGSPDKNVDVLEDIKTNMTNRFCQAASHNLQVNTRRGYLLLVAIQITIGSFIFLFLSLPGFFYGKSNEMPRATKVTITEPIRIQP